MSEGLTGVLIVFVIFSAAAFVVKVVSDNRIRRRLIESGSLDEKAKYLYLRAERRAADPLSSVKWGMVLVAQVLLEWHLGLVSRVIVKR